MRKLRNLLILCAVAAGLGGCAWRNLGPCYGVGCPAWSSSGAPPQKSAATTTPAPKSKHHFLVWGGKQKPSQPSAPAGQ